MGSEMCIRDRLVGETKGIVTYTIQKIGEGTYFVKIKQQTGIEARKGPQRYSPLFIVIHVCTRIIFFLAGASPCASSRIFVSVVKLSKLICL